MAAVHFTQNLRRHVSCPSVSVGGNTVAQALDQVFELHPVLQSYVLDDQGGLRDHVTVFVDGSQVHDRKTLCDALKPDSEVYVMQALSGG